VEPSGHAMMTFSCWLSEIVAATVLYHCIRFPQPVKLNDTVRLGGVVIIVKECAETVGSVIFVLTYF